MPDGSTSTYGRALAGRGTRTRKAWAVRTTWQDYLDPSDIIFAPSAGKARAQLVYRLQDGGYEGNLWPKVLCRRADDADVLLPAEHPIAARLSAEQREIVSHAYGGRRLRSGYRDHFVTSPSDLELISLAWEWGLFSGPRSFPGAGDWALDGTPEQVVFLLTKLGREVAASMVPTYPDA